MTETALRVSVIVPTWMRPDLLQRCLDALQNQTLARNAYEIIVCDDGPSVQAADVVRQALARQPDSPAIHYIEVIDTQGPAAARNRGWQQARASIIAFTDDDTVPDPGWLEAGLATMTSGADAVTGRIVVPLPPRPSDIELDAAGLARAEFVTANCFVRRDALEALGGFDERFRMAWREDSDLHFRLLKGGYRVVRAEDALVVHPLRDMSFAAGARMQKKVLFDVLLYGKHPRLYRERIRPGPPWLYLFISCLLVLAVLLMIVGRPDYGFLAFMAWALVTFGFFLTRVSRSALTPRNVGELFLTSIVIPPLSIFWRLVGMRRFGMRFP